MNVLMILSEASRIDGCDGKIYPTGYWLEEFAVPYRELEARGCTITVATPSGADPVPDPDSTAVDSAGNCKNWEKPDTFRDGIALHDSLVGQGSIQSLGSLLAAGIEEYDGVFVPGGYAPMVDLGSDINVARTLGHFHRSNKPTALFCHGPVALTSTQYHGGFLYRSYRMTAFSAAEEEDTPLGRVLKRTAESLLWQAGGLYERGEKWSSHVVIDRELITGQNTQSTDDVTQAFSQMLGI